MNYNKTMTKQEMLASLEAQIRKDIPRLMELREGCKVLSYKRIKTIVSNKNNSLITVDYLDGGIGFLDKKSFEIIGHDIMLNDVLAWLAKYDFYCITSNGNLMKPVDGGKYYYEFEFTEIKVNLSSPYLKDQSEELINFLYNLTNK